MNKIVDLCRRAQETTVELSIKSTDEKNKMLECIAKAILDHTREILDANARDIQSAEGKTASFIDRLRLTEQRLKDMAHGVMQVIDLPDPIGEIIEEKTVKSGLNVQKVRVPLGVIGIIYEARPNVTVDTVVLCIKSGNAVVLRGSKDAIESNTVLVHVMKSALNDKGFMSECVQLIDDTSREGAKTFMTCNRYVDVLMPRGSASLIQTTLETATIPVIETGTGNCHVYVEKTADIQMAANITVNAKVSRPSVCNAIESLLVDESLIQQAEPIITALRNHGVTIHACEKFLSAYPDLTPATEDDYGSEYSSLDISLKAVADVKEAVSHINQYGTKHSESIITNDETSAKYFLDRVDAAAVYVNASTRFTDGFELGFGAELGISTQKLHARGPIGLREMTSSKYRIRGNGQIR